MSIKTLEWMFDVIRAIREITKKEILELYRDGSINRIEFEDSLRRLGYTETFIESYRNS